VRPARRGVDLPAVEGLRALAALTIVTYHLWQNGVQATPQGGAIPFGSRGGLTFFFTLTAGVPVFFALSGFLLARPFLRRALRGEGMPDMKDWARRRAFRVIPLYMLLVVAMWSSRNFRWPGDWRDLLEHLTFTQDLDGKRIFYTLGPGWSMASEVKFYFLVALLAVVWMRTTRRLASTGARIVVLALPIVALYAFSMGYKWFIFDHLGISAYSYQYSYSFPVRLDGFCVGMAVALWAAHRETNDAAPWRPRSAAWVPVSVAVLVLGGYLRAGGTEERGVWVYPLMALAAAPLIMVLTSARTSLPTRALSWAPLVKLGVMTYSLYLVHEPVLEELRHWGIVDGMQAHFVWQLPVFLAASLLATLVCHYGIELPGLQLLNLWDRGAKREYYEHLLEAPALVPAPSLALVSASAGSGDRGW
jgi:peptidoglycan/LPS O-acetylase OafA/YrhL